MHFLGRKSRQVLARNGWSERSDPFVMRARFVLITAKVPEMMIIFIHFYLHLPQVQAQKGRRASGTRAAASYKAALVM